LEAQHQRTFGKEAITAVQDTHQSLISHENPACNVKIEANYTSRQLPLDSAQNQQSGKAPEILYLDVPGFLASGPHSLSRSKSAADA